MCTASRRAGRAIATGQISTFQGLWSEATQWRLSRIPASDVNRTNFGLARTPGSTFITRLNPPYHSLLIRMREHPDAKLETYDGEYLKGTETKVYRQHGTIAGSAIPLTVISAATNQTRLIRQTHDLQDSLDADGQMQMEASLARSHPNMITHTNAENLTIIRAHLESLYSHARAPLPNAQEVLELASRVHWWAASAAPDRRGSAAKAEFSARAIAYAHGIELPPFKHGAVPDIEAMLSSEEDFVAGYVGLLERSPI